jgi:hypothetical protein
MGETKQAMTFGQRWSQARPTTTVLFWSWVAAIAVTMMIGFTWGGWVTGGTARAMAEAAGENAVAMRLAPICVLQFKQDSKKDQKLKELQGVGIWEKGDYVKKQGWATMPGEQEADVRVAAECAKLIAP